VSPLRLGLPLWLALSLACVASCAQCGEEVVAEIASAKGDVQRDHRTLPGKFATAGIADTLHVGDALRTGAKSEAELKLFPDGVARIEERTLVRFMSERPADGVERLTIEEGVIELDATAVDLELDTGHGIARVKPGSRIRVRAEPHDVQLDVLVGRVQIERKGRESERGNAGETLTLSAPVAAKPAAEAPAVAPVAVPDVPDEPAPTAEAATTDSAERKDSGEVVKNVDFKLASPENATIHASSLPIEIAIPLNCPEGGSVDIGTGKKRRTLRAEPGSSDVSLRLKAGAQKLRMRCGERTRALKLRVVRDAATQELPHTAPGVDVAADGRRYTVHYQNLLPSVAFSWPNAEPSSRYVLLIKRGQAREQRFESNKPEKQLKSGELAEGEHTFTFQAANGKRSPDSSLRISFDNTARSAYLSQPAESRK
jgi:hypothetical protein